MREEFFDSKKVVLKNGLQLVTVKKHTELMAINVGVKVGALYESEDEKGISHFIEHMLFKGTEEKNNEELNNKLENLAGEYNAYTDYMYTVYNIVALKDEMEESLSILSDMVINSVFPSEELEKERGVILSELKSSKDDLEDLSFKKVNEYGFKKSGLKIDVLGKEKLIRTFSRNKLMEYYNKYYVPNNSVISIVSSYEHEQVKALVEKYFESWKKDSINKPGIICENNISGNYETCKKEIEQSTIVFLYTFFDLNDEEELALRVLNHKFGESSNSILFREIRENKGLAYDIYTQVDCSDYIKSLYIYTGVEDENIEETIKCIYDCIENIKNKNIVFNDRTLTLMKKIFKTSLISTLEDASELSQYVLIQVMENRDIYEFIREMESLEQMKSEDIYNIAKKVLNNPTVHILKRENNGEE
ncbi:M16 family metallopeptidase [Hathewaya limosa]|uniref:Zn-dependent peptidase n=1 Tax=Hathewaya limosa TaxID=1536 RepID=A0ABU0JQJ6_HATLI|nr:pitrilysin family protein [Hathewaya limosa]MDQ0478526.1 putative Zn-dependent peptidase [Hathewaya limosa]